MVLPFSVVDGQVTLDGHLVGRGPHGALVAVPLRGEAPPRTLSRPGENVAAFDLLPDGLHVQYLSDVAAPLEWLAADAPEMRQAQEFGRFMANYDGPVARRGVQGMLRRIRADGAGRASLRCRGTGEDERAEGLESFTRPCSRAGEAALRAALLAKPLPALGKCAEAREAFAHCVAAVQRADVPAFRRCAGLPAIPATSEREKAEDGLAVGMALYRARREVVTLLGAEDPKGVSVDDRGHVRFLDARGGEHEAWMVKQGCQWHLGKMK